jgi:NADPH-dependent glutamate synthase beta chain and related oxidoreductases
MPLELLKVNANYSTNDSQVFVAGDSHRGQSLVIWAIYEGRMCAEKINASFEVLSAKV